jgi:hypothetical protein
MQIHQFESLSLYTKACMTWRKGIHIGCRAEGHYYMALYRLEHFYVELQYHTSQDGIVGVKTFTCEDELQPYLDQIDLGSVL